MLDETKSNLKEGKITFIRRSYKVSSKELRRLFKLEGEISGINLWEGRSPNDIAQGKDPDKDTWEISTEENLEDD